MTFFAGLHREHSVLVALVIGAWLALVAGCQPPATSSSPVASLADANLPTAAQPKLRTMKLFVGAHEVEAELALAPEQIRSGMMFRTNITDAEGMLFVFAAPTRASFWMKNVPIDLSCAYLDASGTIREIHPMVAHEEAPIVASRSDIQFILETSRGWFERHKVEVGTVITTPRGTLAQTFLGRR